MTTASAAHRAALERAADEDDAIDDARPTIDAIASDLVADLEDAASDDGVTAEQAGAFADHYVERMRLAAVDAARPIIPGLVERAHGGLTSGEAARLERVTRRHIDDHRTNRRAERASADRKSEPPA